MNAGRSAYCFWWFACLVSLAFMTNVFAQEATRKSKSSERESQATTLPKEAPSAGPSRVEGRPSTYSIVAPTIASIVLRDPGSNNQVIQGVERDSRETNIRLIDADGSYLTRDDAEEFRISNYPDFRNADWEYYNARDGMDFLLSKQYGLKTYWVQVRKFNRRATGQVYGATNSAPFSFQQNLVDPMQAVYAELDRLGCKYEAVFGEEAGVAAPQLELRCPLADFVEGLRGLDSFRLNLEQVGTKLETELFLTGSVEDEEISVRQKLGALDVAPGIQAAAYQLRTQSVDVSVSGNTLKLHFQFESYSKEFLLALKVPRKAPCMNCLPDLHWNYGRFTANITFAGSNSSLIVSQVSISDLSGEWNLAGNLNFAGSTASTLSAVGINSGEQFLSRTRAEISKQVQSQVNDVLENYSGYFNAVIGSALTRGIGANGNATIGYQEYNASIIASVRP